MSSSLCELIQRQKSGSGKMRSGKVDRNHAVFIERTREGDQFYSILATRSSSDSDSKQLQPPHRKQKRRHSALSSSNVWRSVFLTGTFFLALVLLATMAWLVITMKFRLETLEVKVMRLANDVDSLLRTQLTWSSTQTTMNSLSGQIQDIKSDIERVEAANKSPEKGQYDDLALIQKQLTQSIKDLESQIGGLKESLTAQNIWNMLSENKDIHCQITNCKDNGTDSGGN